MTVEKCLFGIAAILLVCLSSCDNKQSEVLWNQSIFQIGSQSSPRAIDLNNDGVKDIIFGAGREELSHTDHGVMALDGSTGEQLWSVPSKAHIVGSPVFYDITNDGTDDVIIGGRGHSLMAIDGSKGTVIWKYDYTYDDHPKLKYAKYNFYNSAVLPDQDNNGSPELLISNGGNWDALPGDSSERYPGVLMLFDVSTGKIIAADTMPDGKETYMSPIAYYENNQWNIIYGSGGETIGGNLYKTTLSDLLKSDISESKVIASDENHGFISPVAIVDVTGDGELDIMAVSHSSSIKAIDGNSLKTLWTAEFDGMESSSGLTIGQFTRDDTPDLFTSMSSGIWPDYSNGQQVMIDGATGEVVYNQSLGCFSLSSGVAYDLNQDGRDEVILSINDFDCNFQANEDQLSPPSISHQLLALDFGSEKVNVIERKADFKNIYSTPWIGDLDDDQYLDIVFSRYFNPNDLHRSLGIQVCRISSAITMKEEPEWGEYMGKEGRGVYR